ncbi:hypothetical protein JW887_04900 [Candidatus Dojkabacteria bacterium]|nr:hypothetical protein [Candidatus Dojkabacteria bacterium]
MRKSKAVYKRINPVKALFLKRNKKLYVFLAVVTIIVLFPIFIMVWMYFAPIRSFKYNVAGNCIEYRKFPIYSSSITVYRNDELLQSESLSGAYGKVAIDFSQDGIYTIEYRVASNIEKEEFEVDRTAPEINLSFYNLTNEDITPLDVQLNEEGDVEVRYTKTTIDENTGEKSEDTVVLNTIDGKLDLELKEGENNYVVYARDEWRNESSKDFVITADYTNPKIEVLSPNYKETYSGNVEVKCNASDKNEIQKVTINGKDIKKNKEGNFVLTISLEDGDNTIEIVAWDKAGNRKKETLNVLKRVGAIDRIDKINGETIVSAPETSSCSDVKAGYNVYCFLNELRKDENKPSMSWNATNANYGYQYAYCLQTTGFQGNPHYPSQDVIDCFQDKVGQIGYVGNGIHSYGYYTASGVANGWWGSPTHKSLVSNGNNIGIGCYGSWCTAYVN